MRQLLRKDIEEVGRFVSTTPERAISIRGLADSLGVSFGSARRRLEAYARSRGMVLVSVSNRVGKRGPKSTSWYLATTSAPPSPQRKAPPAPPRRPPPLRPAFPPLDLPPAVLADLTADEQRALQLLHRTGTVRTSELSTDLGRSPALVDGLMRAVRQTLRKHGLPHFTDEELPGGETLFRLETKP